MTHLPTTNLLLKSAAFFHAAFLLSPKKFLSIVEILRKPFLAVFQGGHMGIPEKHLSLNLVGGNDVIDPILFLSSELQKKKCSFSQFARTHGLNKGHVRWLQGCVDRGQLRWSDKLAGPGWQSMTLAFPATGEDYPAYVIVPRAPRQCAVTDQWFIPTQDNQRFAPGLSEAVKRAARRNLAQAREKYHESGDWGK